jgi:hypothetical protein
VHTIAIIKLPLLHIKEHDWSTLVLKGVLIAENIINTIPAINAPQIPSQKTAF